MSDTPRSQVGVSAGMFMGWNRRQLKTNRQVGEILCPHENVAKPWIVSPLVVHREGNRRVTLWTPGPTIRECCIAEGRGRAIAAWWWEVDKRFDDLHQIGLSDPEVTEHLVSQLNVIEELLEERVPKPLFHEWQEYEGYRQSSGIVKRRIRRPKPRCITILGLHWPCTQQDIKQKWSILARETHPDRNGDPARFMIYNQAYRESQDPRIQKQLAL